MGRYKDGRKRYEFRHVNDLKFAHQKSLAAPTERPKLGRPATSVQVAGPNVTGNLNQFDDVPKPPVDQSGGKNKQKLSTGRAVNEDGTSHATSISENPAPASAPDSGSSMRPVRSTST